MIPVRSVAALLACFVLSACSSQQLYYSAQGWQKNQCDRIADREERERCLKGADMTYDSYKAQTEELKKP